MHRHFIALPLDLLHYRVTKDEIQPIIPPRKNAKIKQHGNTASEPLARDEAIRGIRCMGRKQWKQEIGYHRRSLAETAMYRMECCFEGKLNPANGTEFHSGSQIVVCEP